MLNASYMCHIWTRPAEVAMVPRASDLKLKVPPKHRTTKIDKEMAERAKSTNKWAMIIKKLIIMCNQGCIFFKCFENIPPHFQFENLPQ